MFFVFKGYDSHYSKNEVKFTSSVSHTATNCVTYAIIDFYKEV